MSSWVQALLQDSAAREPIDTYCREWPPRKVNAEVQLLFEGDSKPHDVVIYTDGSVKRDRSGWSSRMEGLYMNTVKPTESRPPAQPWR